jgi:predicted DNA binding CopG/RHH family protein
MKKNDITALTIRLPKEELEYIKEKAKEHGISVAEYMRRVANPEKYKSVIEWENRKQLASA